MSLIITQFYSSPLFCIFYCFWPHVSQRFFFSPHCFDLGRVHGIINELHTQRFGFHYHKFICNITFNLIRKVAAMYERLNVYCLTWIIMHRPCHHVWAAVWMLEHKTNVPASNMWRFLTRHGIEALTFLELFGSFAERSLHQFQLWQMCAHFL